MARILETEPEQLGERRPDLPPEFLRIVRRCLRKKPEDRYNDTRDLQVALKDLREDSSSQFSGQIRQGLQPRRLSRHKTRGNVGSNCLGGTPGSGYRDGSVAASERECTHRPRHGPTRPITSSGDATHPEISADGHFIAYATGTGVVVRDIRGEGTSRFSSLTPLSLSPCGGHRTTCGFLYTDYSTANGRRSWYHV